MEKTKAKVQQSVEDIAEELIDLYKEEKWQKVINMGRTQLSKQHLN